jgi:hypothetical protein
MKAYIINGQGRAGKDTFVEEIRKTLTFKYSTPSHKVVNVSSVAQIKECASEYFNYQGQKTPEMRKLLSDLKDMQTKVCDGPYRYMMQKFIDNKDKDGIIFFHIREPAEIDRFKKATEAKTLLIRRGDKYNKLGNHADDKVEAYDYDVVINNDSTLEAFKEMANNFVIDVIKS